MNYYANVIENMKTRGIGSMTYLYLSLVSNIYSRCSVISGIIERNQTSILNSS